MAPAERSGVCLGRLDIEASHVYAADRPQGMIGRAHYGTTDVVP
jgi:hypothetical protein